MIIPSVMISKIVYFCFSWLVKTETKKLREENSISVITDLHIAFHNGKWRKQQPRDDESNNKYK